jgi:hypothetical protein
VVDGSALAETVVEVSGSAATAAPTGSAIDVVRGVPPSIGSTDGGGSSSPAPGSCDPFGTSATITGEAEPDSLLSTNVLGLASPDPALLVAEQAKAVAVVINTSVQRTERRMESRSGRIALVWPNSGPILDRISRN